ncbi:Sorting nexin-1 [Phytophthora cinnamomi]|uniref:Sorting nexin-1 n=1 Tax=Phytophthora cinnamomi TaxID=4785 RepID=UPI003559FFEA|nr:Sorting nexin-1 [Phytophthora cinnamomi]
MNEIVRRPRRGFAIDNYSCTPATGVWYYRVDVTAYEEELFSTLIDENENDDRSSDSDESASRADSLAGADVVHYSILRRYNDFLRLYGQIRAVVIATEGGASSLPPFPRKEYISPALVGLLWRVSSSKTVLEDRRTKFEMLVQWIENHPVARNCPAFVKFLGKPPQTTDGYVSLKEYASPDWLSSLQQVTQGVEGRKRRYSAGSSAIRSMLERSTSEASGLAGPPHRQRLQAVREVSPTRVLGKRRNRSAHRSVRAGPPHKKVALPAAVADAADSQTPPNADQVPLVLQQYRERIVAQVEGDTRKRRFTGEESVDII